ncbi:MAG: MFS transporter, partial [Sulfurovum sp.]
DILSFFVLLVYIFLAKDAPISVYKPRIKKFSDYKNLLKDRDTWWFMLFYAVSFGGFVGFANYIKVYLMNTYQADMSLFGKEILNEPNVKVIAGYFGAFTIFSGAVLRPLGGAIADKMGGIRALYAFFSLVAILTLVSGMKLLSFGVAIVVLFLIMASLGMANGAIFQLVPQRFGRDIGIMTGLVGAAGGVGGTFLVKTLGWAKETFDSYAVGFFIFSSLVCLAILALTFVKTRWRTTWGIHSGGMI